MEGHSRAVGVYDLGTTSYGEVHKLQQRLQGQRREGGGVDTLLLTEHRPVFTLGRSHPTPDLRVEPEAVRQWGIEIVQATHGHTSLWADQQILGRPAQIQAVLGLVRQLQMQFGIATADVIGHATANSHRLFLDKVGWRNDHTDWQAHSVAEFRSRL